MWFTFDIISVCWVFDYSPYGECFVFPRKGFSCAGFKCVKLTLYVYFILYLLPQMKRTNFITSSNNMVEVKIITWQTLHPLWILLVHMVPAQTGKTWKMESIFQGGKGRGILSKLRKSGNFTQILENSEFLHKIMGKVLGSLSIFFQ